MTEHNSPNDRVPVVTVVGATATGKTSLGVELALRFDGEVVNADSRLFYRGMDIGTAKPDVRERRGVSHHLIDILDPADFYSLSEFLSIARETICDIDRRSRQPIVVGGSGQYIWGLLEGWQVPEIPPDPALRGELEDQLQNEGIEALQRRLEDTGARGIEQVETLNPRRLIRAIERAMATGDAMGGASKSSEPPYDALVIGLTTSREVLHARVESRIDRMVEAGWLEEVEQLRAKGIDRDMPSMSAIGYRQLIDYLSKPESWDEVRESILIGNRRLIGAQNNWFKARDERISWFDTSSNDFDDEIFNVVERWLCNRGESPAER